MKLVAFEPGEGDTRPGALSNTEEVIYDLQGTSLVSGERTPLANAIERVCTDSKPLLGDIDAPTYEIDSVSLSAPVPAAGRVICLGGMYRQHLRDRDDKLNRVPSQWVAPDCAVVGPDEPVSLPERVSDHVVPAVELGVVIGQECRYVSEEDVSDCIAGYTVCNDITARTDWPGPMAYKLMEGFWPTGPGITPVHEVTNPTTLDMTIEVGGKQICEGNTASMRFSLPFVVSYLSEILKLRPGDVISTGDPGRVNGRLQTGTDVTVSIESVGALTNPVIKE